MKTEKKLLKPTRSWVLLPHHQEKKKGISKTVPDEAMGVREILRRYTRGGIIPDGIRESVYDPGASFDSDDLESLSRADFQERDEAKERYAQAATNAKAKGEAEVKAKREAAKQKAAKQADLDALIQASKANKAGGPGASEKKSEASE